MKILFAASEAAPFVKTGGLGDVLEALPQAVSRIRGNTVTLFLPYYAKIKRDSRFQTELLGEFDISLTWRKEYVGIYRLSSRRKTLRIYFIDNEHYFGRNQIYGCPDDGERYAFFDKAVLAAASYLELHPDVISCHDWQTALIPLLLKTEFHESFPDTKSVFTIHNIEYQGICDLDFNREVLGLPEACDEILRFDGCTNFMKSALVTADKLSTVSETYAGELHYEYYSHGLSEFFHQRDGDFIGILNGINMSLFDPAESALLPQNYDASTMAAGKRANKLSLQKKLGLCEDESVCMLSMVTRLAGHKGIDLLCYIAERLLTRRVQLVIVGTGEEKYEWFLQSLSRRFPGQVSVTLAFDPALAEQIYAASDLYLMPSRSEPCGLSQLIAMRFGSVPVVHETGGLKDTVTPYDGSTGRGFTFRSYNADDFLGAIDRALGLYYDAPAQFRALAAGDMKLDFGWTEPAKRYLQLFYLAKG